MSTVLFNGNPLLRYDGYYILSDWAEIPNLRQKATSILSRKMGEWLLGLEHQEDPFLPKRNQVFFALFSVASAIYRWVIVLSIMWFLYKFWRPLKLEIVGHIMGLMTVFGLVGMPLYQLGKFLYTPGRVDQVKKPRFYATLAGLTVLLAAAFLVPLPHRIWCSLEVEPRKPASVYAEVGGVLEELLVRSGQQVSKGQPLARLRNVDLELEINKLEGQRDQFKIQLDMHRRLRFSDPRAADEIPQITEDLEAVEGQLREKAKEHAAAPAGGPPRRHRHAAHPGTRPPRGPRRAAAQVGRHAPGAREHRRLP